MDKKNAIQLAQPAVQSQLTVSNTDIVTMLVVENRKILEDKRTVLARRWQELGTKDAKILYKKISAQIDKQGTAVINATANLIRLLNPKKKDEFDLEFRGIDEDNIRSWLLSQYNRRNGYKTDEKPKQICYQTDSLILDIASPYLDEGADEDDDFDPGAFHVPWGYNEFHVPMKIKASVPVNDELWELDNQFTQINNLLRNEEKFKEKIIAKVTKNVVLNSPELQALTANMNLLEG